MIPGQLEFARMRFMALANTPPDNWSLVPHPQRDGSTVFVLQILHRDKSGQYWIPIGSLFGSPLINEEKEDGPDGSPAAVS